MERLKEYVKKQDFKKAEEPKAGKSKDIDHLIFVVQKHDESRTHYDLRLGMDGVLKSWAMQKGLSLDPKVKHLAMKVKPGLTIQHFNINNVLDRLKETGDLIKRVLGEGIDLATTIKKAQSVFR